MAAVSRLPNALAACATLVLNTPSAASKAAMSYEIVQLWRSGSLEIGESNPPPAPARDVMICDASKTPKRGVGSTQGKVGLIHALANIESYAIDLSWDIIARWAGKVDLPRAFFDDWVQVAEDEAKHFNLLSKRLEEMGSHFGALPAHEALWEAAHNTSSSLLDRLAIVHMVHEARGLDVTPTTIKKLENAGDKVSAELLKVIYQEEITHVTAGLRWFSYLCEKNGEAPIPQYHAIVKRLFGFVKPPFNHEARRIAGMTPEWYEPLVAPKSEKQQQQQEDKPEEENSDEGH